jgi:hypothetical protein
MPAPKLPAPSIAQQRRPGSWPVANPSSSRQPVASVGAVAWSNSPTYGGDGCRGQAVTVGVDPDDAIDAVCQASAWEESPHGRSVTSHDHLGRTSC